MKEKGPEIKQSRLKIEAKNAGLTVAIFAIMLTVTASLAKIVKVVDPPENKYKIAIKTIPSKNGEPPSIDVKLVRQCVDQVLQALPSPVTKIIYKDCE